MKSFFNVLIVSFLALSVKAQTITLYPHIDHVGEHTVRLLKVDITAQYTVVSLVHRADFATGWIRIQPEVVLVAIGGRKKYKFIKAEGIPVAPRQKENIPQGEKTYFKIYFERLEPGVELFDFFECISNDAQRCFNFYGVHVKNPDIQTKKDDPVVKNDPPKPDPTQPNKKPDPKPVITNPLVTIAGKVIDAKTQKPISATITYKILYTQKQVGAINALNTTGYKITLPPKTVYYYTASAKGYLAVEESLDLTKAVDKQVITKNIMLKPIEVGETIRLNNIYFAQGQFYLLSSSFAELDNLTKIMKDNPTMEILLEGHTDIIGNPDDNLKLSESRVTEVKSYLVKKGISQLRIQTKAYGGTKPLKTDGNDEERQINRRVEFKILKK